jgi:N-acetylmuramoyl-L-alanine amidase
MKVAVIAGHLFNTPGKRTPAMPYSIDVDGDGKADIKKGEQYREHVANVGIANNFSDIMKRCGVEVVLIGFDDANAYDDIGTESLTAYQKQIALADCDYAFSFHFNAFGDGISFNDAEGYSVHIHNKYPGTSSEKLAEAILKQLGNGTKQKNRGIVKQELAMCNCKNLDVKGAVLIEAAFMTNKREATELMASEEFWKECAEEASKGFCQFSGVKYVEEKSYLVQIGPVSKINAGVIRQTIYHLGYNAVIIEK